MTVELNILRLALKLTKNGPVSAQKLKRETKLTSNTFSNLLAKLQSEAQIVLDEDMITIDETARVQIAVRALLLGADFEDIAKLLTWREFENIAGASLETYGYSVQRNVRFGESGKRWEIDIVACREPIVICVDCKHWKRTLPASSLKRAAEAQTERTRSLARILPSSTLRLDCQKWRQAKFVPVILSLISGSSKFFGDVPIVPILQFQNFIREIPAEIMMLRYTQKDFDHLV